MTKLKLGTVIDELADYRIVVVTDDTGTGQYAVENKVYGVAEVLTPMLPQALEFLPQLQAALDAKRGIAEDVEGSVSESTDGVLDS